MRSVDIRISPELADQLREMDCQSTRLSEWQSERITGQYGVRARGRAVGAHQPPGTARPDVAPWPAIPLLATDPLRLIAKMLKSIVSWPSAPVDGAGRRVVADLSSLGQRDASAPCERNPALDGCRLIVHRRAP
jgi:hypothetical protein